MSHVRQRAGAALAGQHSGSNCRELHCLLQPLGATRLVYRIPTSLSTVRVADGREKYRRERSQRKDGTIWPESGVLCPVGSCPESCVRLASCTVLSTVPRLACGKRSLSATAMVIGPCPPAADATPAPASTPTAARHVLDHAFIQRKATGGKPDSPSSISADRRGGFLVCVPGARIPLVVLSPSG